MYIFKMFFAAEAAIETIGVTLFFVVLVFWGFMIVVLAR